MNFLRNVNPYLYGVMFGTSLVRAFQSGGGVWWVCALLWLAIIVHAGPVTVTVRDERGMIGMMKAWKTK